MIVAEPAVHTLPFPASRTVTWIHIGDTHLTVAGVQNEIDLGRIIDEANRLHACRGIDFVYVPGDIADDGSVVAYEVFRRHLDRLQLPWFGIVGDHDVHEKSFDNFRRYISDELFSAFSIGPYRFIRLNAFSEPRPDSFLVNDEQLIWLERELQQSETNGQRCVLFLHCYPSDLKRGGEEITRLLSRHAALLIDMGHTHYNEISNDGNVLYTATRSTGQIEEGQVGYSLTTLDGDNVSWHFVPLGSSSRVMITAPADRRLTTSRTPKLERGAVEVHAKIWSAASVAKVHAELGQERIALTTHNHSLWRGMLNTRVLADGRHSLRVVASTAAGETLTDMIELEFGPAPEHSFQPIDQDNAIEAWQERGLLGTQLGPNKNGRKW